MSELQVPDTFKAPVKLINESEELEQFDGSQAKEKLVSLINSLSKIVNGTEIPGETTNPKAQQLINVLADLGKIADDVEPVKEKQRFGNIAYRSWWSKMSESVPGLLHTLSEGHAAWVELDHYFKESFGSAQRLDFGTGHELNFLAFLGGLLLLGILDAVTGADILKIFDAYYSLCQKVIIRYNLEPAGSHGVWGLDDHFHLIYILGAAQLALGADDGVKPKDVLNQKITEKMAPKNLYFKSIHFIYQVKRGNFFEHSPMLYDISGVVSWTKIHRGMIKMYMDEVLGKFPVLQHFWFGEIYSLQKSKQSTE